MNAGANGVLHARGIGLRYPGVQALDEVALCLRAGEVHALLGQNGAGKSSLIKVLSGACRTFSGEITLDGRGIRPRSPHDAQRLGISTVYQEITLCPNLSVAENIAAGRYPRRGWPAGRGIDWQAVNAQARAAIEALQLDIDVTRELGSYPVAIRQMVAIARATSIAARVLVLDEPTSSLDDREVLQLFAVMDRLRRQGMAILFVTHFLDQVYAVADRMTVLRNGRLVGEFLPAAMGQGALIAAMVGRDILPVERPGHAHSRAAGAAAAPLLELQAVGRRGSLRPLDLSIGKGEIVGVAGLLGSGRTELARLVFGLDRRDSGSIVIDGTGVELRGPADAIRRGMAFCPEERKTEGIVGDISVRENIVLALQARRGLVPSLTSREQQQLVARLVAELGITTAGIETPASQLSGGNQQKVLLARWLATRPRLLILDEPTRGIDVAAKEELIRAVATLARAGMAVLFISAEIDEVLRESDRIVVLRERGKVGELPGGCDEHAVYSLIAEHHEHD
jgi:galactofuranose transport system ATP-binding protein